MYHMPSLLSDCKKIFMDSKLKYSDIIELLGFLCYGRVMRHSFFWSNSYVTTAILNKITEKWKLEKKEIKKIFTSINVYNIETPVSGFSFDWFKNSEKLGVVFTDDQRLMLSKIGFVESHDKITNTFNQQNFDLK